MAQVRGTGSDSPQIKLKKVTIFSISFFSIQVKDKYYRNVIISSPCTPSGKLCFRKYTFKACRLQPVECMKLPDTGVLIMEDGEIEGGRYNMATLWISLC